MGPPISVEQRVANEERVWQELGEEERRLEGVLQAAITRPEAGQRRDPGINRCACAGKKVSDWILEELK